MYRLGFSLFFLSLNPLLGQSRDIPPKVIEHLENSLAKKQWDLIGIQDRHGMNVPLFAIHSEESQGIGDFHDLLKLIDLTKQSRLEVIQLLPMNEAYTGSPYLLSSTKALDFVYLHLPSAFDPVDHPDMEELLLQLQEKTRDDYVFWDYVKVKKELYLRRYFSLFGQDVVESAPFQDFVKNNPWLKEYAVFKILQRKFGEIKSWRAWPKRYQEPSEEVLQEILTSHASDFFYLAFVQFLCFEQLAEAKKYAEEQEVLLLGDLVFVPSIDSVDVWANQENFILDISIGAPPDAFDPDGQNWQLPLYDWEKISKDGYQYWIDRIQLFSPYFDIYRLDHVYGVFRIWGWEQKNATFQPSLGKFYPQLMSDWFERAKSFFPVLLNNSDRLPIGEDLGNEEIEIKEFLIDIGVPGIRVYPWEVVKMEKGEVKLVNKPFPYVSLTTTATHDTAPLITWWFDNEKEATLIAESYGYAYQPIIQKELLFLLLQSSHHTNSLFHVNLITEYVALISEYTEEDLERLRINNPALPPFVNWIYRVRPSLEELLENKAFSQNIIHLVQGKGGLVKDSLPSSPLEEREEVKHLSLKQAVCNTLKFNTIVNSTLYDVQYQEGSYKRSQAPFDPLIEATLYNVFKANLQDPFQDVRTNSQAGRSLMDMRMSKLLRNGTKLNFKAGLDQYRGFIFPLEPDNVNELNLATVSFFIDQPLLKGFRYNENWVNEQVELLNYQLSYYNSIHFISGVVNETIQKYWDWVIATKTLEYRYESFKRMLTIYEYIESLLELEIVDALSLDQVIAFLAERHSEVLLAEQQVAKDLQELKALMGFDVCYGECNSYDTLMDIDWIGDDFYDAKMNEDLMKLYGRDIIEYAMHYRYDLQAAQVQEKIVDLRLKKSEYDQLPNVTFFAGVEARNFTSNESAYPLFNSWRYQEPQRDVTVGLNISYPLFTSDACGEIIQNKSRATQNKLNIKRIQDTAIREISEAITNLVLYPKAAREAETSKIYYNKLTNYDERKVNAPAIFAYIEFDRRLTEASIREAFSKAQFMKSLANLKFSTGSLIDPEYTFEDFRNEKPINVLLDTLGPCLEDIHYKRPIRLCELPKYHCP